MGYPFRSRLEHAPDGDIAVIQMKDIDDANLMHAEGAVRVAQLEAKEHHFLRPGDLLFGWRRRGDSAVQVPEAIGAAVLGAPLILIRPHEVLPAFLCWYLNAPATRSLLLPLAQGTSVRTISADALKTLEIPLPPIAVQQRIAEAAALFERERSLMARIATERQRLTEHLLMKRAQRAPRKATP